MITTLYFWKVSVDWVPYFCIVLGFNIVTLLGSLWLPESPRMLLDLGREDEAIENLERIASFNGRPLSLKNAENSSMMINSMETSMNSTMNRSQYVMEQLSTGEVKCNLSAMTVCWAVTSFNFYLITFLANTFE